MAPAAHWAISLESFLGYSICNQTPKDYCGHKFVPMAHNGPALALVADDHSHMSPTLTVRTLFNYE